MSRLIQQIVLPARDQVEADGVWRAAVRRRFSIKREDTDIARTADLTEIGRTLAECLGLGQRSPEALGGCRRRARRDGLAGGRDRAGAVGAVESY